MELQQAATIAVGIEQATCLLIEGFGLAGKSLLLFNVDVRASRSLEHVHGGYTVKDVRLEVAIFK